MLHKSTCDHRSLNNNKEQITNNIFPILITVNINSVTYLGNNFNWESEIYKTDFVFFKGMVLIPMRDAVSAKDVISF